MDKLEKVEKIRQKTGASYTDAVQALDICDGDILDAIVYLEQEGKINEQNVARFSSTSDEEKTSDTLASATAEYDKSSSKTTVGDGVDSFVAWAKKVFKKSVVGNHQITDFNERDAVSCDCCRQCRECGDGGYYTLADSLTRHLESRKPSIQFFSSLLAHALPTAC